MRNKLIGPLLAGATCLGMATGCVTSVKVAWKAPEPQPMLERTVYLAPCSVNANPSFHSKSWSTNAKLVGAHGWCSTGLGIIFWGDPIYADMPINEAVDSVLYDAFTSAGYEVCNSVGAPAEAPIISPVVERFAYSSICPFPLPVVIHSGDASVRLTVVGSKSTIWRDRFIASSLWMCLFGSWGFESRVNDDLTKLSQHIHDSARRVDFTSASSLSSDYLKVRKREHTRQRHRKMMRLGPGP